MQDTLRNSAWLEYKIGAKELGAALGKQLRPMPERACAWVAGVPGSRVQRFTCRRLRGLGAAGHSNQEW